MGRIRTIKPSFTTNEDLSSLPAETHLFAAGLLCYADDEGYFNANPKLARAAIFPLRETAVNTETMFQQLQAIGYIRIGTTVDGRRWGHIVKWETHQRVSHPYESSIRKNTGISWEDAGNIPEPFQNIPEPFQNLPEPLQIEAGTFPSGSALNGNKEREWEKGKGKGTIPFPESAKSADSSSPPAADDTAPEVVQDSPKKAAEEQLAAVSAKQVFAYYLGAMGLDGNVYRYTADRRKKGRTRFFEALKIAHGDADGAIQLMKAAVDAMAASDFHMGRDARSEGRRYIGWEDQLFKSEDKFTYWLSKAQEMESRQERPRQEKPNVQDPLF